MTMKARSRVRRRSGHRLYQHQLADRLTFERWRELDAVMWGLRVQEQIIDEYKRRDDAPGLPIAG